MQGDARVVLEALLPARPARAEDLGDIRAEIRDEALADGASWLPLMGALDEALGPRRNPRRRQHQGGLLRRRPFLAMDARRRFPFYPTGYPTLGYRAARRDRGEARRTQRPVIALIGDGGLLFTVSELATAAELGLPLPRSSSPTNGGYGEIHDPMVEAGVDPIGVDLRVPDLPKLGEAFGGAGLRVEHPGALGPALREALERPGPTLIEVPAPG